MGCGGSVEERPETEMSPSPISSAASSQEVDPNFGVRSSISSDQLNDRESSKNPDTAGAGDVHPPTPPAPATQAEPPLLRGASVARLVMIKQKLFSDDNTRRRLAREGSRIKFVEAAGVSDRFLVVSEDGRALCVRHWPDTRLKIGDATGAPSQPQVVNRRHSIPLVLPFELPFAQVQSIREGHKTETFRAHANELLDVEDQCFSVWYHDHRGVAYTLDFVAPDDDHFELWTKTLEELRALAHPRKLRPIRGSFASGQAHIQTEVLND
eukprot:TRINITY_DN12753_c0_g1_i1.p1 TRINITY_DN12753_c0_g1~~TRINITY_DN12753_c0_g1_i1.p1  ORF type:complete len:268 (+),score=20.19 TRINITY_DN12753_c0_g1_i1:46-849(+)